MKTRAERLSWAVSRARERGLNLAEIGRKSGTDPAHLRRMMKGQNTITGEKAEILAPLLDVPAWWLMCWPGPDKEPAPQIAGNEHLLVYGKWFDDLPKEIQVKVAEFADGLILLYRTRRGADGRVRVSVGTGTVVNSWVEPAPGNEGKSKDRRSR